MAEKAIRAAFSEQAMWCERLGSPFTSLLCSILAGRLDRSSAIGRRVLDWPGDPSPSADNLPARLCGGLHHLVRTGDAPELAPLYPPAALPDAEPLWRAASKVLKERAEALSPWLDNPPQTNEVGRSAALMSGLLVVADRFRMPLHLLELGSSAGLNLVLDRYEYRLGDLHVGVPTSPVRLKPQWSGPSPPLADVRIATRGGVDLRPVDLRSDGARLLAYVWADQIDRRARLEAAIELALSDPPEVDRGDAAQWLEAMLTEPAPEGSVRVIMHSIAFQYFPRATQERIANLIERGGGGATATKPLAWLRFEQAAGEEKANLRLKLWPGGEDRLLAWCHAHGASVDWLAQN